jgi:signal transduction histidine kinase
VFEAIDGEEALHIVQENSIDLISMDIEMPGMDGFQTYQKLVDENFYIQDNEDHSKKIPIIFITSLDSLAVRERGFEVGAADFLTKPFSPGRLISSVDRLLLPKYPYKGLTALIADDSQAVRSILSMILKEQGLNVLQAKDGQEAYQIAAKKIHNIDLIVTDVIMPHMDGEEFCRKVRFELYEKEIPILFLSSLTDKDRILNMFKAGATDYLIKPFVKEELIARIQIHMNARLLNKQLRKKVLELDNVNKLKDEFLAICSHDLRNPLAAINSFATFLLTGGLDNEKQNHFFKIIKSSSDFLLNLVNNLLDLQQFQDENSSDFTRSPMSIYQSACICMDSLRPLADAKNISMVLNSEVEEDTFILGNPSIMTRIINNLLSNAIKFTHQNGLVTMELKPVSDNELVCKFIDNGIGIPPKNIPYLFDKFSKISQPGTAGEEGTGLGMAIVKELIEKHDGRIEVTTKEGVGTTFNLYFPTLNSLAQETVA